MRRGGVTGASHSLPPSPPSHRRRHHTTLRLAPSPPRPASARPASSQWHRRLHPARFPNLKNRHTTMAPRAPPGSPHAEALDEAHDSEQDGGRNAGSVGSRVVSGQAADDDSWDLGGGRWGRWAEQRERAPARARETAQRGRGRRQGRHVLASRPAPLHFPSAHRHADDGNTQRHLAALQRKQWTPGWRQRTQGERRSGKQAGRQQGAGPPRRGEQAGRRQPKAHTTRRNTRRGKHAHQKHEILTQMSPMDPKISAPSGRTTKPMAYTAHQSCGWGVGAGPGGAWEVHEGV